MQGLKTVHSSDQIVFGGQIFRYGLGALSWMLGNNSFSIYDGKLRQMGYLLKSSDCGETWIKGEEIKSFKITGDPNTIGNGLSNIIWNQAANAVNRGFVSYIDWGATTWDKSRIYPIFPSGTSEGLEYQAIQNGQEIPPVIGSPDLNRLDHFYSPAPIVNEDDPEKSILLYFGGWRAKSNGPGANVACTNPPPYDSDYDGVVEEDCSCGYSAGNGRTDMCTGDRIFVATNRKSITGDANKLNYQVFSMNGTFSTSGWDSISGNFQPVISSAQQNNTCPTSRCPFKIFHANDPSAVRLKNGKYIVYFTGAFGAENNAKNYTHLAESSDGVHFGNYSILRRASTAIYFPFGLDYNYANGTAKVFYAPSTDTIYMVSIASPDLPGLAPNHPDSSGIFIYELRGSDPTTVIRSRRLEKNDMTDDPIGTIIKTRAP